MLKSIEDLRPAKYNPRKISKDAASGLSNSLKEFGDISGIVWNERTGNLVAGHQRVEQLKALGGVFIDGKIKTVSGEFNVRVVDWDESKEKAANVTANNPFIGGEYTDDLQSILKETLSSIGEQKFDELSLDDLYMPDPVISEVDTPELSSEVVVKTGDVWLLGEHTLFCGDSTHLTDLGSGVDCVFREPPYGVDYVSRVDEERWKNWGVS